MVSMAPLLCRIAARVQEHKISASLMIVVFLCGLSKGFKQSPDDLVP
jgi:hypothetical protein